MSEKIIKSSKRVKDHAEVYTPSWLVKDMLDLIPEMTWKDIDATFLEPSAGNGNFVVQILERKLGICNTADERKRALQSIYAIELLEDNLVEMKERMREIIHKYGGIDEADIIIERNIQQGDFLKMIKNDGSDIKFYDWRGGTGYHSLKSMVQTQQTLF